MREKIRGVPMQSWQVRALLAGTMSQFRIPLRKQPTDEQWIDGDDRLGFTLEWNKESHGGQVVYNRSEKIAPPYQPGEVLFIKETWEPSNNGIRYRADGHEEALSGWWRPPQHMREADSRKLRIRITSVGMGRRRKISLADVLACGITQERIDGFKKWFHRDDAPGLAFAEKWDVQHAKRSNGWAENGCDWRFGFELTD